MNTMVVRTLLAMFPLATAFYALLIGQDVNWDLRNYHFYNPFAFLTGRMGHDVAVSHVATYYNPLMHVPFYWAVSSLPPKAVGFILGLMPGLNAWLLYGIARQAVDPGDGVKTKWFCLASAMVGMLGVMNLAEIGTSYGDNVLSLPVLAAVWLIVRFRERLHAPLSSSWPVAGAAGLLTGIAFGLKLPFAVYTVALCAAFFGLGLPWRQRFLLAFVFGLGVLAGAAASGGFWALEMWQRFQNPVFPYFNHYFESPWGSIGSYRDERFIPTGMLMWLTFPIWFNIDPMQVGEVGFRDLRFPLLYLLMVALLVKAAANRMKRHAAIRVHSSTPSARMPVTAFFIIFVLATFVLWMKLFAVYRYLMVGEMLVPLTVFLVLGALLQNRRRQLQAALAGFLLLLVTLAPGDWGRRPWAADYFGVEPPPIEKPESTIVLMAGHDAMAYMIPFFPHPVRFLRIQGYVTGPSESPNQTDRLMREIIAQNDGALLILYRAYEEWHALSALKYYRLEADRATCVQFVPRIEPQPEHPFFLCEVRKIKAP
ncbi:MAG: hypothetical protein R6V84_05685 [Desulfobacterales bacterium]